MKVYQLGKVNGQKNIQVLKHEKEIQLVMILKMLLQIIEYCFLQKRQGKKLGIDVKQSLIKKDDNEKIVKQQSKLTFNGIHNSYDEYDSFTFKQNEILLDKPIFLGFAVLE